MGIPPTVDRRIGSLASGAARTIYHFALLLLSMIIVFGSSCGVKGVADSLDRINDTMSQAVQTLGEQSSAWQATLTNLQKQLTLDSQKMEGQIKDDVSALVNQVSFVANDAAQNLQASLLCTENIIATHVSIALRNLLNTELNKWSYKGINNRPIEPFLPTVCTINPKSVTVDGWPDSQQLELSGADFNLFAQQKPLGFIIKTSGQEVPIAAGYINQQTNYMITISIPLMIRDNRFDTSSQQIIIKWNGQKVNNNEIPVIPKVPCGGIGQPCCSARQCTGGLCRDGRCVICGGLGQPCCEPSQCDQNLACSAGGQCIAAPQSPTCSLIAMTSEESQPAECPPGGIAKGIRCTGEYCDNVSLNCCWPLAPADQVTLTWSGWFSDENPNYTKSSSGFVGGVKCRGRYCDDMNLHFRSHFKLTPNLNDCYNAEWISEEGGGKRDCDRDPQYYIAGMKCRGQYCDDISLYCCRLANP